MRNPFTRHHDETQPPRDGDSRLPPPNASFVDRLANPRPRSDIAEVEMIGRTAVATLTIIELSQDAGAEQLAELLLDLSETGAQHFVLDVQNVQYMDTTCLGCLVEALNRLAAQGGQIALVNPNHSVHYVFRLTRLDRVFRLCSDVPAALDAVEQTRQAG